MSDIECSETIQAPPMKRKYTRKPKVVVQEPPVEIPVEPIEEHVEEHVKPKRTYTRRPKPELIYEPVYEHVSEPEPEPEPVKEKKPRTEKQIAAFNRMREARIKKQQELEDLKAFQKEKDLLEKEQAKIHKLEDKIVKNRVPKTSKKTQVYNENEPEHIINHKVSTIKPILFV
jgi:hypothetical protein